MRNSDALLAGIATVAIISSILSWRRLAQTRKELEQFRKGPGNATKTPTKNPRPATIEENGKEVQQDGLHVRTIGTIRSVYRLCVGTPRQGLLAPSARGCIQLHKLGDASTAEAVSGLEGFSHVWILFVFHLNTQSSLQQRRFKSKISPPALGGEKVGIYATRSPHRANPIGITLCKLDRIQVDGPHQVTLHVSGLDLVDGTPVLDIKPYVPVYDSVNVDGAGSVATSSLYNSNTTTSAALSVPSWVDGGLKTFREVKVSKEAEQQLRDILAQDPQALEFYGPHRGDQDVSITFTSVMECIRQVLAMDVRSSFQTQKTRNGKFQAEKSKRVQAKFAVQNGDDTTNMGEADDEAEVFCTQQLDNIMIEYQVQETSKPKRGASGNSGAEDLIVVRNIRVLPRTQGKGVE